MGQAIANGVFVLLGAIIGAGVSYILADKQQKAERESQRRREGLERARQILSLRVSLYSEIERLVFAGLQEAIKVENAVRATTAEPDPDKARERTEGSAWLAGDPEISRAALIASRLGDNVLEAMIDEVVSARGAWAMEITNWANAIADRDWDDINSLNDATARVQEEVGRQLNALGLEPLPERDPKG